jgi:peptide deformylase
LHDSPDARCATVWRFCAPVNDADCWLHLSPKRSIGLVKVNPADLTILRYPAPTLRVQARLIQKIDDQVKSVAARMIELTHEAGGVGLAAPQVGLPWRMFVTNIPDDGGPKVFINPKLTGFSGELSTYEEGCLSLPGIHVEIQRPNSVNITALDLEGNDVTRSSNGFPARVWQHEFDHLNGALIIDRLNPKDRQAAIRVLRENKNTAFNSASL